MSADETNYDLLYLLSIPTFMLTGTCLVHLSIYVRKRWKQRFLDFYEEDSEAPSYDDDDDDDDRETKPKFEQPPKKVSTLAVPYFDPMRELDSLDAQEAKEKSRRISRMHLDPIQDMEAPAIRPAIKKVSRIHLDPLEAAVVENTIRKYSRHHPEGVSPEPTFKKFHYAADNTHSAVPKISVVNVSSPNNRKISRYQLQQQKKSDAILDVFAAIDMADADAKKRRISRRYLDPIEAQDQAKKQAVLEVVEAVERQRRQSRRLSVLPYGGRPSNAGSATTLETGPSPNPSIVVVVPSAGDQSGGRRAAARQPRDPDQVVFRTLEVYD